MRARDVHRSFRDSRITLSGTISGRCTERDHLLPVFHDNNGMDAVKPRPNIFYRARARFKGCNPVFDAFVVDAGNCRRIYERCNTCCHETIDGWPEARCRTCARTPRTGRSDRRYATTQLTVSPYAASSPFRMAVETLQRRWQSS